MSHYLTEEEIKAKAEEVASLQENSMIAKEYLVPQMHCLGSSLTRRFFVLLLAALRRLA